MQIRGLRYPLRCPAVIVTCVAVPELGEVTRRRAVNAVDDKGRVEEQLHPAIMVIVPVAENVCYVADAVALAVAYRLVADVILSAVDDDAVAVVVMYDLTVTSAVGIGPLRHGRDPYRDFAH